MLGVGRKSDRLLFALILLLITPFLVTAAYLDIQEHELNAVNPQSDYAPAQLEEMGPITITDEQDFENYGFPGDGTESNPYLIENANISSLVSCISISNVNASFVIRNGYFESIRNLNPVIHLWNVNGGTIEDSTITGGSEGILSNANSELQILTNTIRDSSSGIRLINSVNITTVENSIYSHSIGVELVDTFQSVFQNNRVYANRHRGFSVDALSEFNSLIYNLIGWNELNTPRALNAEDYGANNSWVGNLWSDYVSPGPYNVSGGANAQDNFASTLVDTEAPRINSPDDIIMGEGSQVSVIWLPIDAFPFSYTLLLNGETSDSGVWIDQNFVFDLQDLEPGDYYVTLSVADGSDNHTEDIVYVSVLLVILGDIGTELVAYASALSVVVFLVVLCIFRKKP